MATSQRKTDRSDAPVDASAKDDRTTRDAVFQAACEVFAERGYDRATGKEICRRAGTNTAAVNYYFGGIDRLYTTVVQEAHSHVLTLDGLSAAVADMADPKAKLRVILEQFVRGLTGPASASWVLRVLGREVVAPTPVFETLRETEVLPKSRILRATVAELTGLSEEDPAVARGCLSVIAPCLMLLVVNRGTIERLFPSLRPTPDDTERLVDHMVRFSLAGLAAIGAETRGDA